MKLWYSTQLFLYQAFHSVRFRVSQKLRPRKLRPQTQKTQTLGCLENSDPKNSDPRASRKLRPKKLRRSGVSKTQTQKTQTLGCLENSDPKKLRPSGVSKTRTQKNPSRKVDVPFSHGSKNQTPLCKVHYKVLLCKARLYYIALSLFPFKLY